MMKSESCFKLHIMRQIFNMRLVNTVSMLTYFLLNYPPMSAAAGTASTGCILMTSVDISATNGLYGDKTVLLLHKYIAWD